MRQNPRGPTPSTTGMDDRYKDEKGDKHMPCFARVFQNAIDLLRERYRIKLRLEDDEEMEEIENWLKEKLEIKKEEKHEKITEKLEELKKKYPNKFRQLEYEFIQFVKKLRKKRLSSPEKEPETEKKKKKKKEEKKRKKKKKVSMYT